MHSTTIPSSVIEPIDPIDIDLATESEAAEIAWDRGLNRTGERDEKMIVWTEAR
jgi:hypothetical protein